MPYDQQPTSSLATSGLTNLGNSCFMNSVLQCLAHTPPLVTYMHRQTHSHKCKHANKHDHFCSACQLEKLVNRLLQHTSSAFAPRAFADHLPHIARGCRLGRQEDAHEFLRCLLDHLTKCFNPAVDRPKDGTGGRFTVVQSWFQGSLQSQICCLSCGAESNTHDLFLDLSLELQSQGAGTCRSVVEAMKRFTKPEYLEGENGYKCEACSCLTRARKQFRVANAPRVLTIHLKRFSFDGGSGFSSSGSGKISSPVTFEEEMDLSPFMSRESAGQLVTYKLCAILVHEGASTHSGHYYAYAKGMDTPAGAKGAERDGGGGGGGGSWWLFNDSYVRKVGISEVLGASAYILLYEKEGSSARKVNDGGGRGSSVGQPGQQQQQQQQQQPPPYNGGIHGHANGGHASGHACAESGAGSGHGLLPTVGPADSSSSGFIGPAIGPSPRPPVVTAGVPGGVASKASGDGSSSKRQHPTHSSAGVDDGSAGDGGRPQPTKGAGSEGGEGGASGAVPPGPSRKRAYDERVRSVMVSYAHDELSRQASHALAPLLSDPSHQRDKRARHDPTRGSGSSMADSHQPGMRGLLTKQSTQVLSAVRGTEDAPSDWWASTEAAVAQAMEPIIEAHAAKVIHALPQAKHPAGEEDERGREEVYAALVEELERVCDSVQGLKPIWKSMPGALEAGMAAEYSSSMIACRNEFEDQYRNCLEMTPAPAANGNAGRAGMRQ